MTTCFLGSVVLNYNIRGAFNGNDEINLDVSLAEFDFRNPTFNPPTIGTPVLFQDGDFEFYGITDTYKRDRSSSGNPTYSVQLNTGNFILGGVELILNDYYGSVNAVPNLLNVFGYMENFGGFGASNINSAGMSWYDIAATTATLANTYGGGSYGNGITYKGYQYKIDLSALPSIPTYYRINNGSINLLDFVSEVCSAGGHDFFFRLVKPTAGEISIGWAGTFQLITISRIAQPSVGKVDEFVENTPCATSRNYGQEVRKDVHSKFVIGANIERMYFNYNIGLEDNSFDGGEISIEEYANDTVLPFFGTNSSGNVIIGFTPSGEPGEYYFNIDVSDIDNPVATGDYLTCLGELRAARKSRQSWERYLCTRNCNEYTIEALGVETTGFKYEYPAEMASEFGPEFDAGGGFTYLQKFGYGSLAKLKGIDVANSAYTPTNRYIKYNHNGNINYYYKRASQLNIAHGQIFTAPRSLESDLFTRSLTSATMLAIYNDFKEKLGFLNSEQDLLKGPNVKIASRVQDSSLGNFNDNKTDQLYRRIKGIADTYYNRKYMVSIPFTLGAFEPESLNIRMSQDIASDGYLDESAWATAYDSGLIPNISGLNTLLTPENKFYPFVKYENCVVIDSGGNVSSMLYDFSEIGEGDKIFNSPVPGTGGDLIYDCWVKCNVDSKIYFQDNQTLFGPRAVIEVPGSVKNNNSADYPTYAKAMFDSHAQSTGVGGVFYGDTSVTAEFLKKSFDQIGGDDAAMHDGEELVYADLYAIPLRSKLLCYGPWYAIGADGKVSYERNEDLNPWSYGGFTSMNNAGLARVNDGVTNQTFSEVGSITVIGAPTFNFGDVLISGGPYVTDISCSFGSNGITTTYSFQAWSSHRTLSKLNGYAIERNKRISNTLKQMQSNYRTGLSTGQFKNAGDFYNKVSSRFIDLNDYTRKERSNTSHKIISGSVGSVGANVVSQPNYNAGAQAYTDYENKAFMSLDGIYRPFSTIEKSGWPHFEVPTATGSGVINSYTLNPLDSGNDITALAYGTGLQPEGLLRGTGEVPIDGTDFIPYRAMGLKLPMIGVGWGYDTNGSPVPTGTGVGEFRDDYLYNMEHWKAGPIDLRWDNDRKVWTGGNSGGGLTIRFRIIASYFCGECYVEARVISTPYGLSIGDLPDVDTYANNQVRIYDRAGCYFNEPPEDLVNRIGYATYMTPLEDGPCPDTVFSAWECTALCCTDSVCS